ncbi:MAG: hypothetical protein EBV21_04095 [Betaproteobacteria bacterium]|nr:hypothetical protein [Betaproteobacteria bacterium]
MFYGEIEGGGFEVIEPEFAGCFVGHARLERLWTGCRWAEGPAWFGGGRYLIWSDLPNNHLSYAVQWFLFAFVALVIYALAVRKRLAGQDAGR